MRKDGTLSGGWVSNSYITPDDLGISKERADWFIRKTKWCRESSYSQYDKLRESLSRFMYAAGALEHERSFLGPLYRFMSLHPRGPVRAVPPFVRFFLKYPSDQIARRRHYPCEVEMQFLANAPRVDAQASETRTGLGAGTCSQRPTRSMAITSVLPRPQA